MTKFHCLVAFTSWDIRQYVYCNCLLTRCIAFLIIFKGLSMKQIIQFFLEGESPTLKVMSNLAVSIKIIYNQNGPHQIRTFSIIYPLDFHMCFLLRILLVFKTWSFYLLTVLMKELRVPVEEVWKIKKFIIFNYYNFFNHFQCIKYLAGFLNIKNSFKLCTLCKLNTCTS